MYCRERFDSRRQNCCSSRLGGYEGQDKNWHGFEKKKKVKRVLPVVKRSGILPLGILGSLASGAAGIAKVMNDNKAAQRQLEELKCHNRVMEGHELYLAPYKSGQGFKKKETAKRLRNFKNAKGFYHKRTITTTGKPYAHSIL